MRTKCLAVMAIVALLFTGCNSDPQTIKVKNQYSVVLPSFLSEGKNLHDDASLQYQNLLKEFYVIVIDEPSNTLDDIINESMPEYTPDVDGYSKLLMGSTAEALNLPEEPILSAKKINGMDARVGGFSGEAEGQKIFWKAAYFKGKKHYYQMLCWTQADKQKDYEPEMDNIINSFKELGVK
ncbi:hypothetical protein ACLI1A_08545 [Flavobacterium sp. RHBU_3]|uniref:hypothetical protein n=1 Tax=Flavobacterium sp. RHBU_3 TaxID=3391184 RepID=UPI003985495F